MPGLLKYATALILTMLVFTAGYTQDSKEGVIDLRLVSLANNSIALDGFWLFYPNQLIRVEDQLSNITSSLVQVPSWWKAASSDPQVNYATFRMKIVPSKEDLQRNLALKMPPVYSAYSLWVNGELIGANGKVGTTAEDSKPQWKPQTYPFHSQKDTLEIIIHLSNFHHDRSGINESVYLGDTETLTLQEKQTRISGSILFFSLWVFAMIALIVRYLPQKKDVALIYYASLCVAWSLRSIFSNYYLVVQWFPDISWNLCVKVEYITLYLSTLFGSLLIGRLFPRDVNKIFRAIYVAACSLFTVFTLLTPPSIFTQFVQLYVALSAILLISIGVIVTKAYIESRHGLNYLLICLSLAVIMFAYVILAYQGLFELNELVFNGGFFVLFLFSGIAMAHRLNKMATTQDYDILTIDHFKHKP